MPAAVLVAALALPALGQGFVGPDRCQKCHKKLATPAWKLHKDSGAQLDPARKPNAGVYAKATGGNPKADACKRCHAPDAATSPATVSCETCHGAGKEYLDPHQERPFYGGSNLLGMLVLHNQAGKIAQLCTRCHVLTSEHQAIADLGHPTGDTFKVGEGFAKIKHWWSKDEKDVRERSYGAAFQAEIDKAAAPQLQKALKSKGRPARPVVGAAAAPNTPASAATETAAPDATPPPAVSGVLGDLLADLRKEGVDVRTSNLPDAPAARFERPSLPPRPVAPTAPAAVRAPAARAATAAEAPEAPRPVAAAAVARDVFELRGMAAARLAALLRARKSLDTPVPAAPARFAGPDGELLDLQDEVLALALEALRKKP